ncbi:MAG: uncharacterized protein JWP97_5774 [Labilithrix sp.]|nr:uncharacterized protein [Labilithrix sp.]
MAGLLTDGIERLVPWWLRKRAGLERGFTYLWASALMCDVMIHSLIQGIEAAWPGYGTPTALTEIGATRGIVQGLSDSDAEYAARLRAWLDNADRVGSDEAIVRCLHDYLLARPMVRIVDRHGQWTEINAAGVLRTFTAPWDWDSISAPSAGTTRPTDVWVIVYGAAYTKYPTWASHDLSHGIGHNAPLTEADQAIAILKQAKPAHNWIRCVLWVDSPSQLDPELGTGLPDGRWGKWSKDDGSGGRVPSRNANFRYWEFDQ